MFNATLPFHLYLDGTYLSDNQFPRKSVAKRVDCNQVEGVCNATFQFVEIFRKGRYENGVFYVTPNRTNDRRRPVNGYDEICAISAPQWPIHRRGSLSPGNLGISKRRYGGDSALSCCKTKSSPSACSCGNSQSWLVFLLLCSRRTKMVPRTLSYRKWRGNRYVKRIPFTFDNFPWVL